MSPRVASYELRVHRGSTDRPVGAARASTWQRDGVLLTLTDDAGTSGQGEGAPLAGFSVESLDDVVTALEALRGLFVGKVLRDPRRYLLSERVRALPGAARFALETAVFDLAARRAGVPLRRLLSPVARDVVAASAYVGAALHAGTTDAALEAVRQGFGAVKVKLTGLPGLYDRELVALRALREALPREVLLRLDVNGAWSAAEAPAALARLRGLRVELVEQPTAVGSLHVLGRCAVPWAIDESLADTGGGCVAAVIKPAVHGLLGGAAIAARARVAGKGVAVTHFFDGPIGTAAACELALAVGDDRFPAGLAPHGGLAAWPPTELAQLATPGLVRGTERPGHGVTRLEAASP
jgi:L-alanine-DL-glutamate epimerase-like enolase superfamily enzyme